MIYHKRRRLLSDVLITPVSISIRPLETIYANFHRHFPVIMTLELARISNAYVYVCPNA
jgi:hypothetical protein